MLYYIMLVDVINGNVIDLSIIVKTFELRCKVFNTRCHRCEKVN